MEDHGSQDAAPGIGDHPHVEERLGDDCLEEHPGQPGAQPELTLVGAIEEELG